MLEFEMPKIRKEFILEKVEDKIGFEKFKKDIIFGCRKSSPQINYFYENNGNRLTYVRILNSYVNRNKFYDGDGVVSIPKPYLISNALSNLNDCSESVSIFKQGVTSILKSENNLWTFDFSGHKIFKDMPGEKYMKTALDFLLEFYHSNNL